MKTEMSEDNTVKIGDYVIIQRQNFTKLHKVKSSGTVTLGRDVIELENIIGKLYCSTFRMVTRPKNKRVYSLEESDFVTSIQNVNIDRSGEDNRDIVDDGTSQQLTTDEIHKLRDDALSSSDIVEKLISNSKTFSAKTEYSQEKYLKKKEKKYFEYIQVRKPTLRLLIELYYRQDPGKIQGVRIDDLSQILAYANVDSDSKVLLYDSGSNGLLSAAVMNALGKNTTGVLIHAHPGNVCQKEAFLALKFPEEQSERCINVCLYSVLRCYYQEFKSSEIKDKSDSAETSCETLKEDKDGLQTSSLNIDSVELSKESNSSLETSEEKKSSNTNLTSSGTGENAISIKRKLSYDSNDCPTKRPCWQIDNERACKILDAKADCLIIVAKEHPLNIFNELTQFLNNGRSFVVFSLIREVLEELYVELKTRASYIAVNLSNNLLRNYQVLENRTHPDVNMNSGGYILTGFKVDSREIKE